MGYVFTMLSKLGKVDKIEDITGGGTDLVFVAFPGLITKLGSGAPAMSAIFFFMCLNLGIDSVFGFLDYYIAMINDVFPGAVNKWGKEKVVGMVVLASFIPSLMFCMQGGFYNFDLFDLNCAHVQLLLCLLAQSIFIPWVFGMHKFSQLVKFRTGQSVPKFYVFVVRVFCPVFSFIMLHLNYTSEFDEKSMLSRVKAMISIDPEAKKMMTQDEIDAEIASQTSRAYGLIWGGRMLFILPLVFLVIGICYPLKGMKGIHQLIEEQYGIKFTDDESSKLKWYQWLIYNLASFEIVNKSKYDRMIKGEDLMDNVKIDGHMEMEELVMEKDKVNEQEISSI